MKNLSIWAWLPEDYNPQGQNLSFTQIRQHVQLNLKEIEKKANKPSREVRHLSWHIRDWAYEEMRNGNNEEVTENFYRKIDGQFDNRRFFYIEYLPDTHFHDFHAMLIKSATELGLIVLSDYSEAVFYPDGTSEPSYAFKAVSDSQEQEMRAEMEATGSTVEDFLSGYHLVNSKESAVIFAHLVLKDYLDKKGVSYKINKTLVEICWQDCVVKIILHPTYYDSRGFVIERGATFIFPNKVYISGLKQNPNSNIHKNFSEEKYRIGYEWIGYDSKFPNPNFMGLEIMLGKEIKIFKLLNNHALYEYIHFHLNLLFDFLQGSEGFDNLVRRMYEHSISSSSSFNYFSLTSIAQLTEEISTLNLIMSGTEKNLSLLNLINSAETVNYFNKLKNYYAEYIAKLNVEKQQRWQDFIDRMAEQLDIKSTQE